MSIDRSKVLEVAKKAARAAGAVMNEFTASGFKVSRKGEIDLVTEADVKCEETIVGVIHDAFPDHAIVAEEGGESGDSPYKWIIDPIDGTTNFAHGFPVYCSSIGFTEEDGEVIVGAVYDPSRDEMFSALKGEGAKLNETPISVSTTENLIDSLLATGFPYEIKTLENNNIPQFETMAKKAQAIRRPGAAALDLCYVACGRLDGFWEYHLHSWDMAAGALLITEAGGEISTSTGNPHDLWGKEIVASNGSIHQQIVEILSRF